MSEMTPESTPPTNTPPPAPPAEPAPPAPPAPVEPETPVVEGEDEATLPEWARKKLAKANGEAAKYRTELRTAQEALKGASTPEQLAAVQAELTARAEKAERAAIIATAARKFALPDELVELLSENPALTDAAALEAAAKKLQKFAAPSAPGDLSGGLNPGDNAEFDPVKAARDARRRY